MLHTKAQGHWPFGSGEEEFLPYTGMAAILVMWPRCPEQTFVPPNHGGSTWNLASIGPAVLEKKIFENCGRTDDGACLYYKLTNEPKGSGELTKHSVPHNSNTCIYEPPHDKTNIRPVWSVSLLCAQWVTKDRSFLYTDSEDSDQTGWMPTLIRVFAWRTCHFIGFVMRLLI